MKHQFILIIIALLSVTVNAQVNQLSVTSPDKATKVTVKIKRSTKGRSKFTKPIKKTIDIVYGNTQLIRNEELNLTLKVNGKRSEFGYAELTEYHEMTANDDSLSTDSSNIKVLSGWYKSLTINTDIGISLEIRVYNNGVAYRYKVARQADEYKILTIPRVFSNEKPIAILGTYTDSYVFPWNIMTIGYNSIDDGIQDILSINCIDNKPKVAGIVSWKDALSSFSVGSNFSWFTGGNWKNIAQTYSFTADATYKYLYGGITYAPCNELLYIYYGEDYTPFTNVMGSIHSWGLGCRIGFNLPIQNGFNVWNITPYIGTTLMHLFQHGDIRIGSWDVHPHNQYLVGAGIKIQCAVREQISLGISYDYQFFTHKETPLGMNSLGVSLGYHF